MEHDDFNSDISNEDHEHEQKSADDFIIMIHFRSVSI